MNGNWGRSIEQLLLIAVESKVRVLGVVSPDSNSGVSSLCHQLAEASQNAGWQTLLADFSETSEGSADDEWNPGETQPRITRSNRHAYDLLRVRITPATRSRFNNIGALQQALNDDLKRYDRIIVDLPPVLDASADALNPVAAARACDTVVMVCMAGRITRGRLAGAVSSLDAVSVRLGGLIINDLENPTLGQRVAARALKMPLLTHRFSTWLAAKAKGSDALNTPL